MSRPAKTLSIRPRPWMLAGAWLMAGVAQATEIPYPSELPPVQAVQAALAQAPMVQAARAGLQVGQAEQRQLAAGSDEWTFKGAYGTRQVDVAVGDDRFREWDVALERAVRLPGKAGLDAQLGALRVVEAETAYGDARHETARQLLQLWYGWLREQAAVAVLARQADSLGREAASLARRKELGDASTLEQMQGEAAYAQAQATARQAAGKEEAARALLHGQFPDLPLPTAPAPPDPPAAVHEMPADVLAENHELRRARVEVERRRLEARRAEAEQHADPTVGMLYNRERGGEEKVLGLYVSIPFGGTGRRTAAEAGQAQAVAAEARALGVRRKVEAEWSALQVQARSALRYWQLAQESASRLAAAADKVDRARRLGAADLAAVLVARRQANEAELQTATARIDALESQRRLALDTHLLWDFDAQ